MFELGEVFFTDAVVAGLGEGVFGADERHVGQGLLAEAPQQGLFFELLGFLVEAAEVLLPVVEVVGLGFFGFFLGLGLGVEGVFVELLADGELFDGVAVLVEGELAPAVGLEELLQVGVVAGVEARGVAVDAGEDALEFFGVLDLLALADFLGLLGEVFADLGDALFDFGLGGARGRAFVAGLGDGALHLLGLGEVLVAVLEPGDAGLLLFVAFGLGGGLLALGGGHGFEGSQALLGDIDVADFIAGANGLDGFFLLGDLVGQGGLPANAEHGIPSGLGSADEALPCPLNRAEVGDHCVGPAAHGVGVGLLGHGAGFEGLALLFQRLDLGVDRGGEVVVLFVELFGGLDGLAAKLGEVVDGVLDVGADGAVELDGGLGDKLDVAGGNLAGPGSGGDGFGRGALGAAGGGRGGLGHVLQLGR